MILSSHNVCFYNMQTAKCYYVLFSNTPLSAIVSPSKTSMSDISPSAPPPQAFFPDPPETPLNGEEGEFIENTTYPELGNQKHEQMEPEGEDMDHLNDCYHDRTEKVDAPSKYSDVEVERKVVSEDPPSCMAYPEDEVNQSTTKYLRDEMGESVYQGCDESDDVDTTFDGVDDDEEDGKKKEPTTSAMFGDEDSSAADDSDAISDKVCERDDTSEPGVAYEGGINDIDDDDDSLLADNALSEQAPTSKESIVVASSIETDPESYYDIHEAAYSETKEYLEMHSNLTKYLEEFESIVSVRVQARHTEYVKHRKSLQHYIKKMEQLHNEEKKMQERNKPLKPKQIEKIDRNAVKLTGARETHDSAGETLYLLLDEFVNRSWRDIFPLLQRSITFEKDYASMQAEIFGRLNGVSERLGQVGIDESVSIQSRLESLKTLNPEVIYTGPKGGRGLGMQS
jgi:hypothetical protein